MDTRPLGETGQHSSLLTFGAIALDAVEQDAADEMVETVLDRGVTHVDERTGEDSFVPADLS